MRFPNVLPAFALAFALGCSGSSGLSSGSGKKKSPAEEATKQSELTQTEGSAEEEAAIPPESIAGAFLTCDVPAKTNTNDAMVFGCSAFDAAKQKLNLAGVDARWDVIDNEGQPVSKEELTDAGEFDKAWVIAQKDAAFGLNGQLTLPVADGKSTRAVIKSVGQGSSEVEYQ